MFVKGGLRYSPEHFAALRMNVAGELPDFIKAVESKRVAILDEQKSTGKTIKAMKAFVNYLGAKKVVASALSNFPAKPEYSWRKDKVRFARKAQNEILQFLSRRVKDKRTLDVRKEFAKKVTPKVINRLRK